MSQGNRLKELLNTLRLRNKDFAKGLSLSPNYISILITNKKKINDKLLLNITKVYPDINIKWLEFGEGEMFLNRKEYKTSNFAPSNIEEPTINYNKGIPYYDIDFISNFDFITNKKTVIPKFFIDFAPFNDADFCVNVTGNSMHPLISHGDIIALKNIETWKDFLLSGEVYAIVTKEFKIIRKIGIGKTDKLFNLIPYNKSHEFSQQQINKNLIQRILKVNGCIKKFF